MTNADWIKDVPVAHRGYHDLNKHVWENTLSAFSRAVEAGFAGDDIMIALAENAPVDWSLGHGLAFGGHHEPPATTPDIA